MAKRIRPSWDQLFMEIAMVVSKRSSCINSFIGAVIVTKDNDIISTGYNGSPSGLPNCSDLDHCVRRDDPHYESGKNLHNCVAVHSEINAILMAAKNGHSTKNSTLYCTHQPCKECAKQIVNSGITEVIYVNDYANNPESISIMEQGGLKVRRMTYVK